MELEIKPILATLSSGSPLREEDTFALVAALMQQPSITEAQIGAVLLGFALRIPSFAELAGAARALRAAMVPLPIEEALALRAMDTCGTGGSGKNSFNTSTAAAFVAAAAGIPIAKHGNRAATSQCGSADLLEALGFRIDCSPATAAASLREAGFCFMFAPLYHGATRRVQLIRKELGLRTIFNFLGPLVNPAGVRKQLLGVSDPQALRPMAEALRLLGTQQALVVCGDDGLDEISITGPTKAVSLQDGAITELTITTELLGVGPCSASDVTGMGAKDSASMTREILSGKRSSRADLVAANAGAAIYLNGACRSLGEGVSRAREILVSGKALPILEKAAQLSHVEQ